MLTMTTLGRTGTVRGVSARISSHLVGLVTLLLIGVTGPVVLQANQPNGQSGTDSAEDHQVFGAVTAYRPVDLYFGHGDGRHLAVESRRLAVPADPVQGVRNIVDSWLAGPRRNQLVPLAPRETSIRGVYVTSAGTAYIDFDPAIRERSPEGCQGELLTVYGLVNSLVLNIPQVKTVKILIAGAEATTLAGHILLREPFQANLLLVR